MNKKVSLLLWLGVLVVFLAGSSFVGYKLWRRQKDRALMAEMQRWEVKFPIRIDEGLTGAELSEFLAFQNEKLDRYEVLWPVVTELDLVALWGLPDNDAALAKLKECSEFREADEPGAMLFVVSDKEKEMADKLRQSIGRSFDNMLRREKFMPPPPPPGYTE